MVESAEIGDIGNSEFENDLKIQFAKDYRRITGLKFFSDYIEKLRTGFMTACGSHSDYCQDELRELDRMNSEVMNSLIFYQIKNKK